jgi:uncharacterized protein YjbJ (UPF0337 family)
MADEQYTTDPNTTDPNANPGQDLQGKGLKDQVQGKAKEVAGKVQSGVGDLTGDESTKMKGKAKEAEGKVQQTGGKVEDKIGGAINPNDPTNP